MKKNDGRKKETACSPALIREMGRCYEEGLSAILACTADHLLLAPCLPAVAQLYGEVAKSKVKQVQRLGELLRELGKNPCYGMQNSAFLRRSLRPENGAYAHAAIPAKRMLRDSATAAEQACNRYRRLAAECASYPFKPLLEQWAVEEAEYLQAFSVMLQRLERS